MGIYVYTVRRSNPITATIFGKKQKIYPMKYATKISWSYQDRTGKCLGDLAVNRAIRAWEKHERPEYAFVGDFKDQEEEGGVWLIRLNGRISSYDFQEKYIEDIGKLFKRGKGDYELVVSS